VKDGEWLGVRLQLYSIYSRPMVNTAGIIFFFFFLATVYTAQAVWYHGSSYSTRLYMQTQIGHL